MMKPAQPRQRSHYGVFCWLLFDDAMIRRVLRQRIVNAVFYAANIFMLGSRWQSPDQGYFEH